jgi:hypothetical protein
MFSALLAGAGAPDLLALPRADAKNQFGKSPVAFGIAG